MPQEEHESCLLKRLDEAERAPAADARRRKHHKKAAADKKR